MPIESRERPNRSPAEIFVGITVLNQFIGGYPPRFRNEGERERTYTLWSDLIIDARAPGLAVDDQQRLYLLGELLRQGHNFDVDGAGEQAESAIESCISGYPRSIACHISASHFYLAVIPTPMSVQRARRSLDVLRQEVQPQPDAEVEEGYVFLYLAERKARSAAEQIDRFIGAFPDSPRAAELKELRAGLESLLSKGVETIELREWHGDDR